jgi:hypothetical protein
MTEEENVPRIPLLEPKEEKIEELQAKLKRYEENGVAKLYYSLNRKAWEMADLLNNTNLRNIGLDDPKDKTFDRLKVVWQDAASIAAAVKALGEIAGVTGDEKKDVEKKPFVERLAQDRN